MDGKYSERWITSGSFDVLSSSKIFVGGSEVLNLEPETEGSGQHQNHPINNWVGCLKDVSTYVQPRERKGVEFISYS